MKRQLAVIFASVFLLGAAGEQDPPKEAVEQELAQFQGTWTVVSMEMDGKFMPAAEREKISLTIQGENFTFKNGANSEPGLYKIDPTQNPKQLNIVIGEGQDKGKVYL